MRFSRTFSNKDRGIRVIRTRVYPERVSTYKTRINEISATPLDDKYRINKNACQHVINKPIYFYLYWHTNYQGSLTVLVHVIYGKITSKHILLSRFQFRTVKQLLLWRVRWWGREGFNQTVKFDHVSTDYRREKLGSSSFSTGQIIFLYKCFI